MGLVLPPIEVYQVQHLPIVKAYADKIGLVETINQLVPTEMAIDPGTIVLGMILDTLSGRSPLYRLEEFFTHQDTALLLGKAVPPEAFQDDTVGRILERLYATGTMKVFTACAVRADRVFGFDKRYVHFDTTSITVYGRAGRCWGKPQNSDKMTCPIHWPLEPGEAPVCASHCNSSSVTITVTKKPSPMSSPSTSITNASNISG